LTLDSRLEELNLSRMTQNTLKRAGCTTVRSVVEIALERRLPRFGEVAREEVELALRQHGIVPPPALADRREALSEVIQKLEDLQRQIASDMSHWQEQLNNIRETIRTLE
jgi:hypothetical protein